MLAWFRNLFRRRPREPWRAVPAVRPEYPSPLLAPSDDLARIAHSAPAVADWHAICRAPYTEGVLDCSNKAAEYVRRLRRWGHTADVWAVETPDGLHAVAAVWSPLLGAWRWCDPTCVGLSWVPTAFGRPLYRFSDAWIYDDSNREAAYPDAAC